MTTVNQNPDPNTISICQVPFHGGTLPAVFHDNRPKLLVSGLADYLGIDRSGLTKRFKRDPAILAGLDIMSYPDARGVVQPTSVLDVRHLAYALATIDVNRVKEPTVAQRIVWLKEEARDVLYAYFMPQIAAMDPAMRNFLFARESFESQRAMFDALQTSIFLMTQNIRDLPTIVAAQVRECLNPTTPKVLYEGPDPRTLKYHQLRSWFTKVAVPWYAKAFTGHSSWDVYMTVYSILAERYSFNVEQAVNFWQREAEKASCRRCPKKSKVEAVEEWGYLREAVEIFWEITNGCTTSMGDPRTSLKVNANAPPLTLYARGERAGFTISLPTPFKYATKQVGRRRNTKKAKPVVAPLQDNDTDAIPSTSPPMASELPQPGLAVQLAQELAELPEKSQFRETHSAAWQNGAKKVDASSN
jgi:hypothetical protein